MEWELMRIMLLWHEQYIDMFKAYIWCTIGALSIAKEMFITYRFRGAVDTRGEEHIVGSCLWGIKYSLTLAKVSGRSGVSSHKDMNWFRYCPPPSVDLLTRQGM